MDTSWARAFDSLLRDLKLCTPEGRHVQTSGSLPALSDNSKKTIRVSKTGGKK